MSDPDALDDDMARFDLDADTAERLLRGTLAPGDAPPGYGEVARLLGAVPRPQSTEPLLSEAATVAAVAEAVRSHPPTPAASPRRSVFTKAKLAAAGLTGALALTTGLAAANALPGAAQSVASDALDKVGVSVPNPNNHSAGHAGTRGKSGDHTTSSSATPGGATTGPNAHADFGLCTAEEAHQDNGAQPKSSVFPSATTCSTVVHPGQGTPHDNANPSSEGDTHKPASAGPPSSTPGHAPVATPNGGGTSTANTASNGHSSAGSENSSSHKP